MKAGSDRSEGNEGIKASDEMIVIQIDEDLSQNGSLVVGDPGVQRSGGSSEGGEGEDGIAEGSARRHKRMRQAASATLLCSATVVVEWEVAVAPAVSVQRSSHTVR